MFLKNPSLKWRLTVSYSLTAFVLIACAIIFLYYILTNQAQTQTRNFLSGELNTIANILKLEHNAHTQLSDLRQEMILEPKTNHYNYFARIIKPNQQILLETPGLSDIAHNSVFPSTVLNQGLSAIKKINHHHQQYSLMSLVTQTPHGKFTIQVALNSSETKQLIEHYQYYLWLLLLASVFLATLIGTLVTNHGLKPISNLNKLIQSFRSDEPHTKLDSQSWPIELQQTIFELNDMLKRIHNAFERLKNFSSDIAHELRTPLNTIICQAEVTLSQSRRSEDYINSLATNIEECHKMAKMIDDMLLIARSKDTTLIQTTSKISLRSLVTSATNYLQIIADEKNIRVIITGDALISGDATLLKRAFLNLILNSINYSDHNKTIHIDIEEYKRKEIKVTIRDEGYGIREEDLAHIFDRFYRVEHSRTRRVGGTGLGLAIVKSIINSHQGHITVTSTPEKGSIFSLHLPK